MKLALVAIVALAGCLPPEQPGPRASPLAMIEASADLDGAIVGPSNARATIVVMMASWCSHCRVQLAQLNELRPYHPSTRILGVSYQGHEEYDNRGNAHELRAYVTEHVPWLRVVPANQRMFEALGRPPFIPAVWVYSADGQLVEFYDRREREPPSSRELDALLRRLGA